MQLIVQKERVTSIKTKLITKHVPNVHRTLFIIVRSRNNFKNPLLMDEQNMVNPHNGVLLFSHKNASL